MIVNSCAQSFDPCFAIHTYYYYVLLGRLVFPSLLLASMQGQRIPRINGGHNDLPNFNLTINLLEITRHFRD